MGLLVVIIASLALKITNPKDLSKSIDYNLAIIIVLSLALGTAMIKSELADLLAESLYQFLCLWAKWVSCSGFILSLRSRSLYYQ